MDFNAAALGKFLSITLS